MLGVQSNAPGAIGKVKWLFFEGGTPFDAFLTAASAQVRVPAWPLACKRCTSTLIVCTGTGITSSQELDWLH